MALPFLVLLVIQAAVSVGVRLLTPKPKDPKPQEFKVPDTREGVAIPVVWGTRKITPTLVWWGNPSINGDKRAEGGGWRYYADLHFVLCHGQLDDVSDILFDEKEPRPKTIQDNGDYLVFMVRNDGLFGGIKQSGGIVGDFHVYLGKPAQAASAMLAAMVGTTLPAYQGVAYIAAQHPYLGTSPVLPSVSVIVARFPNQLGLTGGKHKVNTEDSNPACILYEILTDQRWGLGLSSSQIDIPAFQAAGNTLFAEGLGLSPVLDQQTTARDFIQTLLKYVDGVVYAEPTTGKITFTLARADYIVANLPHFHESNGSQPQLTRPDPSTLNNVVRGTFTDRSSGYVERPDELENLAATSAQGGRKHIIDEDLSWITNASTARLVIARMLNAASFPLGKLSDVFNREAWALRPGSAFRYSSTSLGLVEKVFRVTRPQSGSLDDGRIHVDAVEDIFGIAWTGYPALGASGWVDPLSDVTVLAAQKLVEMPYALLSASERRIMTLGVRGSSVTYGYEVWSDPSGGSSYAQTKVVEGTTPSGTLTALLSYTGTSFIVGSGTDINFLGTITAAALAAGENLVIIDNELIAWQTITDNGDGTWTISGCVRGVADTTPATHSAAARAYFLTAGYGQTADAAYPADLTLAAKLLPWNTRGVLAIGSATAISLTTANRAARPYVPSAVKLNAVSYPTTIVGALTVSWSHRNRLGAWDYSNAGATAAGEAGTTYTLRLYGNADTLLRTYTAIAGTSQVWSTEAADSGGSLNTALRAELEAVVGGVVSHQKYNFATTR